MTDRRIIPRTEWGARHAPSSRTRALGDLERWLHHTAGTTLPADAAPASEHAVLRAIELDHENKWGIGIGYTFLVTPSGRIYEGHPVERVGAHTQGHNTAGAGIALVGNYENAVPTGAQLDAVAWLLRHGVTRGWWKHATLSGGHRDTKATACPGRNAYPLIAEINRRATTPAAATPAPAPESEAQHMRKVDLSAAHTTTVTGDAVGVLQGLLLAHGHGPKGLVDAKTGRPDRRGGAATKAALGAFQDAKGLVRDYVAGPKTNRALVEV